MIILESVDSTNTYIRENPCFWHDHFLVVRAINQTGGRGRFERSWHSRGGEDLAFSTIYITESSPGEHAGIPVFAGLAVQLALKDYVKGPLKLKWPNDILHGTKKIGGILCESVENEKSSIVIIGIGINVNSTVFHKDLAEKADSLKGITGRNYNIEEILYSIMKHLKELLATYRYPLPESIMEQWCDASVSIGRNILYEYDGSIKKGILEDVKMDLSLLIRDAASGEVINYKGEIVYNDK